MAAPMFAALGSFSPPVMEEMPRNIGPRLSRILTGDGGNGIQASLVSQDAGCSACEPREWTDSIYAPSVGSSCTIMNVTDEDSPSRCKECVSERKKALFRDLKPTARSNATLWLSEILSLLVATCILVAIVLILTIYNKKEQPQWSTGDTINLSTLVAVLSTIFRSLLAGIVEASKSHLDSRIRSIK